MKYDWLVIGAGLYGATFARLMTDAGKKVLVLEKNDHVGGHCHSKPMNGIHVPTYGPHTFHTNNRQVWNFINKYGEFNQVKPKVLAHYRNKLYSLPFNMWTFNQLWGCKNPVEARQKIESQRLKTDSPKNFEEFALSIVGTEIYETFIKGYTTKQWGRPPKYLPVPIAKRIPLRFTFDDCYWSNAMWCGMPINGYTSLVENMLNGIEVRLNDNFSPDPHSLWGEGKAEKLVYTGSIDKFFNYKYGALEYRTLKFKTIEAEGDYQGVAQTNYTEEEVPFTRIVEHKHFYNNPDHYQKSFVTFEYPDTWDDNKEPYYPIIDDKNLELYKKYKEALPPNIIVGGRLGTYKYLDMDQTITNAIEDHKNLLNLSH